MHFCPHLQTYRHLPLVTNGELYKNAKLNSNEHNNQSVSIQKSAVILESSGTKCPLLSLDWKEHWRHTTGDWRVTVTVQNNYAFKAKLNNWFSLLTEAWSGIVVTYSESPQRAQPAQCFLQSNKLALFYF